MEEETRYVVCATRLLDQWYLKDVTEWRARMVNFARVLLLSVMMAALSVHRSGRQPMHGPSMIRQIRISYFGHCEQF